nr:DUF551 domain-containing protein [Klebsiella pneumoniae]
MTSKLTRERIELIANFHRAMTLPPSHAEIEELARIALAALDSEPVRSPVLAYADSYRDMAKQGVESVPIWSVITDLERNIAPLYRHAQPAPVVDADDNFYSWFGREWQDNYQHNQYTTAAKQMLGVMAESAWKAATERQRQKQSVSVPDVKIYEDVPYEVGRFKTHRDCYCDGWNACRAAMLAAAPQSPGSEPAAVPGKWIPVSERMPDDDDFVYIWPRPDFGVELHVGQYCECSPKGDGWYAQVYEQNYGIEWHPITVTHWMPLPVAPQEVK